MAWESPSFKLTGMVAGADLSAKQYYFVKLTAAATVNVCSAVTDIPLGVLQNAPVAGREAEIMTIGVTKLSSDEAITAGNMIGTSADGQGQVIVAGTDTTVYLVGQALTTTTAVGGIASVLINCAAPSRAS